MRTRARWLAVVFCLLYGFAKLKGSQFTILDSELSKPMGPVNLQRSGVRRDASLRSTRTAPSGCGKHRADAERKHNPAARIRA
jgi:hypothetical protein